MRFQTAFMLSIGLWLAGVDGAHVEMSRADLYFRANTPPEKQAINCEKLKGASDCTGSTRAKRAKCTLRYWEKEGCEQAATCKADANKKQCCDNRDRIPFDAGYFYSGYMRACAPKQKLKAGDRPQHKWLACTELDGINVTGMERNLRELYKWEQVGCIRAARCADEGKNAKADRVKCCKEQKELPEKDAHYSRLFAFRYAARCWNESQNTTAKPT
ncbi:hypothetical protein QQS21_002938 [Conoideocrella luteorostrata]|uniref:Uncharacterized protein n=1 Tax=Conoideocrella luteorostrata TaxID=1105319 RepID=A0AAJ0CU85_9HYPO|nr:hypothetical protein QQS21_002938 [Conoideocrella luteorostrata]